MSEEEEWVKTAMSDDSMVVEMLLRLHQAQPPPAPTRKKGGVSVLQLEWSVRQRRWKQVLRKRGDATRASPTTPLSWSGGTSVSGGAVDGLEESSKLSKPFDNTRSKVVAARETTTSKRSRKKKTLTELKEEENLLLNERRNLENKLATLRLTFEKRRSESESLKRMKLDVLSHQTMKAVCGPSCTILPANGTHNEVKPSSSNGSSEVLKDKSKGSSFLLPDLNLPFNGVGNGNLHGVS